MASVPKLVSAALHMDIVELDPRGVILMIPQQERVVGVKLETAFVLKLVIVALPMVTVELERLGVVVAYFMVTITKGNF